MFQRFAIVTLLISCVIFVEGDEKSKDHYPIAWTQASPQSYIDNERLYPKYKVCLVKKDTTGCPAIIVDFKKELPEMFETKCARCLPSHKEWFKMALEYICHRRRDDFDEVRGQFDPDGKYWEVIEQVLGKVDC